MKTSNLFPLAMMGWMVISSCQREGCTDPVALNFDPKAKADIDNCLYPNASPSVAIVQPSIGTIELAEQLEVDLSLADDQMAEVVELTLTSDLHGDILTATRSINSESPNTLSTMLAVPDLPLAGVYCHLNVTCSDAEGFSDHEGFSFTFADQTSPILTEALPSATVSSGEYVDYTLDFYDKGGIKSVLVDVLITPFGTTEELLIATFHHAPDNFQKRYLYEYWQSFGFEGKIIIRYQVTDLSENKTSDEVVYNIEF